jgi:membrane protein implicated in regulation of membrane protease activity
MSLVYLFALVVALGILLVQLAMGGKGDGDGDPIAGDAHAHTGVAEKDIARLHPSATHDFFAFFLSLRFWIFAMLGFGLSGTLLHLFDLAGPVSIALIASLAGLASGAFATWALRVASHSPASSTVDVAHARGRVGRVLVPCARGKVGQIRVELQGQSVDLLATADDDDITRGEYVLVIDFEGDIARVARRPRELA